MSKVTRVRYYASRWHDEDSILDSMDSANMMYGTEKAARVWADDVDPMFKITTTVERIDG